MDDAMKELLQSETMLDIDQYVQISELPFDYGDIDDNKIEFGPAQAGSYKRLSNFFRGKMTFSSLGTTGGAVEKVSFVTVEHFYQSERYRLASLDSNHSQAEASQLRSAAESILKMAGPGQAKEVAKEEALVGLLSEDFIDFWDSNLKIGVMRWALWKKFAEPSCFQDPRVGRENAQELKSTGEAFLQETCKTHKDYFWGVTDGVGENVLGRLLMELRKELDVKGENAH